MYCQIAAIQALSFLIPLLIIFFGQFLEFQKLIILKNILKCITLILFYYISTFSLKYKYDKERNAMQPIP